MLFTIITVTLNDLNNLRKTAESIIIQNNSNFQWIIKDCNSTDGTEEFIKTISKRYLDKKIVFLNIPDSSIYDAMNQAIPYSKGVYTLFLNSGDCLLNNETLNLVKVSIENDKTYDFVYGDNIDVIQNGEKIYKKSRDLDYLKHSLPTSHQAIFYNSNLLQNNFYNLNYKICGDYELTARLYYNGYRSYKKLNFPIVYFPLGGISQQQRHILLKEGYLIHRKIVMDSWIYAKIKLAKRFSTLFLLDRFPYIYKILRKLSD